jgi:hypothetical protein
MRDINVDVVAWLLPVARFAIVSDSRMNSARWCEQRSEYSWRTARNHTPDDEQPEQVYVE